MSRSIAVILSFLLAIPVLLASAAHARAFGFIDDDGDVLNIGLSAEPETLDPHRATSAAAATLIMTIFDPLIVRDARGNFQPALAETWDVSADGKEYAFHLRVGVTFHDGTTLDAAAVKFNFDRIADPASDSGMASTLVGPYSHTEIIDPRTIRVVFDEPNLAFLDSVSQPFLSMVSPTAVSALGDQFGHQPVGTGFMMFDEWDIGDHIALSRNEEYTWGSPAFAASGPAGFERMRFHVYPEESARLAAFQAGEVDVLDQVQPRDLAVLGEARAFRELDATALGVPISLVLNLDAAPTNDLAVRQALNHVLDRDQIVSFAFRGASQPARGPLAPETPFAIDVPTSTLPYDPDFAASLLDAAGWEMQDSGIREKDGQQLVLRWAIGPWDAQWAELAQAQFSQLGAVVQIIQLDVSDFDEAMRGGAINMISLAVPGSDPIVLQQLLGLEQSATPQATPVSQSNLELDALLRDAATATTEQQRKERYAQVQALIVDESLIVPVALWPENVIVATEIAGIRRDFRNGLWLHDAVLRD